MTQNKDISTITNSKQKPLKEERERLRDLQNKLMLPLTAEEQEVIRKYEIEREKRESPFCYDKENNYAKIYRGNENEKFLYALAGIAATTGAYDLHFGQHMISQCSQASSIGKDLSDDLTRENHFNSTVNILHELRPADAIEGMLNSRLVAIHTQIMYNLSGAANDGLSSLERDTFTNRATKLSRIYNETLETLNRYRRRGEQRVVVQHQHVSVDNGSQAILNNGGNMFAGGGGVPKKIEE